MQEEKKDRSSKNEQLKLDIKEMVIKSLILLVLGGFIFIIFTNIDTIINFIYKIYSILTPFIYGLVLAYLKYPLYSTIKTNISKLSHSKEKEYKIVPIILTEIITLSALVAVLLVIVPKFVQSILDIVNSIPLFLDQIQILANSFLDTYKNTTAISYIEKYLEDIEATLNNILQTHLIPSISNHINQFANILKNTGTIVVNFIFGIILSILTIYNKENIFRSIKSTLKIIIKPNIYKVITEEILVAHRMMNGFFIGKFIDSFIIGIICFITCEILKIPYALVVAIIVGITNIIPIIGPCIGAVPCIFIILSISPIKAVEFTIFIIILQQFDGHILGPKLLGNSTGLSTLSVLFAITLFGGLFGIIGMLIGIPLLAVLKDIFIKVLNYYASKKKLKTNINKEDS